MPTGELINGRLFNVTGDAIDGLPQLVKKMDVPYTHYPHYLKT
jgi:F-type H+-transporting ATPase subunit beta